MPDNLSVEIEVDVNIDDVSRKLQNLRQRIQQTIREFDNINKKLNDNYILFNKQTKEYVANYDIIDLYVNGLKRVKRRYEILNSEILETNKQLKSLKRELAGLLSGEVKVAGNIDDEINAILGKIDKYERKLEELKKAEFIPGQPLSQYRVSDKTIDELIKSGIGRAIPKEGISKGNENNVDVILGATDEAKSSLGKINEANKELKNAYDVLKSTKATRMDKNIQLFTASVFEGIMAAFDTSVGRVAYKGKNREVVIGRRLAALAIKPEQFYATLVDAIFGGDVESFVKYMEAKFNISRRAIGVDFDKKTGEVKGISTPIDPIKVVRDLALGGGRELGLSTQLRMGFAQGLITNIGVQFSSLTAKIGIIGVILKKIFEVMEKMVKYSGVMNASLKLLTLITQLSIKPVADVIGSVLLPILMIALKVMLPFLKKWNKIFSSWMRLSKEHPMATTSIQLSTTLLGFLKGGLFGGFAGAILPMMTNYLLKGNDTWGRVLAGTSLVPILTKMLGVDFGIMDKFSSLLGNKGSLVKSFLTMNKASLETAKAIATLGKASILSRVAVATNAIKLSSSFLTLIGSVGGIVGAFAGLGYSMLKISDKLTHKWEVEGTYEKHINSILKGIGELGSPINSIAEDYEDGDTSNGTIKMNKYWKTQAERWNAIAEEQPEDWSISALKDMANGGDTSKFDEIIKNISDMETNLDDFSKTIKATSQDATKIGDTIPDSSSDLLSSILNPIVSAKTYWSKNGGDIFYGVATLRNVMVDTINKSIDEFSNINIRIPSSITMEASSGGGGGGARFNIKMYQTGGWVDETGLAIVHRGEYVVPRERAFDIVSILRDEFPKRSNNKNVDIHNNFDISISIEKVSNDYDLDDLVYKLADKIMREIEIRGGI